MTVFCNKKEVMNESFEIVSHKKKTYIQYFSDWNLHFTGCSVWKIIKKTSWKMWTDFWKLKNMPPLKHILAILTWDQICTVSEIQPFTFVMFQTEHPVNQQKEVHILKSNAPKENPLVLFLLFLQRNHDEVWNGNDSLPEQNSFDQWVVCVMDERLISR